jgi:ribonuclease HII
MSRHLALPKWPTLNLERELGGAVCGVDEAGYAPLAGPVVAAAVILPAGPKPRQLRGLTDSKLVPAPERERFYGIIRRIAHVGVGMATVDEIDRLNIFHADMLAMQRAVENLGVTPDTALVDGRAAPVLPCTVKTLVKGDRRSLSIAAASIIAKVVRDRLMRELGAGFPGYGWERNAGYGAPEHYLGLLRQGPTVHHRRSFAPLSTLFGPAGPPLPGFRFEPLREAPDIEGLLLLELRHDLHAVFDGAHRHIGQLRNLRGHWTFHATGYDTERSPEHGGGPCAQVHGERLAAPEAALLRGLLARCSNGAAGDDR